MSIFGFALLPDNELSPKYEEQRHSINIDWCYGQRADALQTTQNAVKCHKNCMFGRPIDES